MRQNSKGGLPVISGSRLYSLLFLKFEVTDLPLTDGRKTTSRINRDL